MRTIFKVSIAVLFFSVLAWASNPWESKPYTQWTQKEVLQVLNDSPWAQVKAVHVTWKKPAEKGERGEKGREGSENQDKIEARWVSSKTIREALVRQDMLSGKMTAQQAQSVVDQKVPAYEMVLFGQDLSQFGNMSDADAAKTAYIIGKKTQVKAVAAQAKVERANGRVAAVIFAFPKTVGGKPVIGPGEKQLDFQLSANKLNLNMQFNTQKMTTKSGLDL